MTLTPGAVEVVLPARSHVRLLQQDDDWTRAILNGAIDGTRAKIERVPLDWVEREILACQLIGLSAHLMHQERGYEARDAISEAEESLGAARQILETIGDLGSASILQRFTVIRAVVQYNASVLFYETDNDGAGDQFLGYARDTLAGAKPDSLSDEMYRSIAAAIDALGEVVNR